MYTSDLQSLLISRQILHPTVLTVVLQFQMGVNM